MMELKNGKGVRKMVFWDKIKWDKVILSGLIFTAIAMLVRQIEAMLTLSYYQMPEYFGVWSQVMMPEIGPPPAGFMVTSLLFSLFSGCSLAVFYELVKPLLARNALRGALTFTKIVFGLSLVFFTLPVYLLFNVPMGLLIWWLASSAVIFFLSAMVFAKILK